MANDLISTREASQRLGVSPRTISRWAVRKEIGRMCGQVRVFTAGDVSLLGMYVHPGYRGNPRFGEIGREYWRRRAEARQVVNDYIEYPTNT